MMRNALAALFSGALLVSAVAVAAQAPASLEAYGRLPTVSNVVLSPDGLRLALVGGAGAQRQIRVLSLDGLKTIASQPVGDLKIRSLRWAGSDHLLVTVSSTNNLGEGFVARNAEWSQLVDLNIPKNSLTQLMTDMHSASVDTLNVIVGSPLGVVQNGRPVAYVEGVIFPNRKSQVALFRIDLTSGDMVQMGQSDTRVRSWTLDREGKPLARSLYEDETGEYALELAAGGGWRTVFRATEPLDRPYVAGLGREPGSVMFRVHAKDRWSTYDVPAGATSIGTPIEGFDDGGILHEPATGKPIGVVSEDTHGLRYHFFEPSDQKQWEAITRAFTGEVIGLSSWSEDRSKAVLLVEGPKNGSAYYLVDMKAHRAEFLADQYADLPVELFNPQRPIAYKAQDGTEISAYLTLPKGRGSQKLPLVVLPHGGPASQDDPGFDWWSQALASRGYAVLQPQFRGSDGLGGAFLEKGYGQWGRKMQTDLSDGVADLARQGVVDPKRVCIVGASYGGYAALAGVTLQQGVYRCAVSLAGPADLGKMIDKDILLEGTGKSSSVRRYWTRFMGVKTSTDPVLAKISPALQADKASAPVLLIHGADDTVVPFEQSQMMERALRRAGKPVEFVTLPHEDHWLSKSETRLKMLSETLRFLNTYNPVDGAAPTKQVASS